MNTQTIGIQSSEDRLPESGTRRIRVRRRPATPLGTPQGRTAESRGASTDHPNTTNQAGGARILRRWSVADLIARAGGAPRAFA
jgi:hypothetical protein